jgi:hypothetical protein
LGKSFVARSDSNSGQNEPTSPTALQRQQSVKASFVPQGSAVNTSPKTNGNRLSKFERSRRRMTKVDPNLSITDITRVTRSTEMERRRLEPINRKDIFKFECEGDIQTETALKGMHVKWKASFDRPIEELIYPSLQRFDNDTYEEKRKHHETLHGHSRHGYSALGRTMKLDMLDSAENNSGPRMMFIHAPKWSVSLENRRSPTASPNRSPSRQQHDLNESSLDAGDSLTISVDYIPTGIDFSTEVNIPYKSLLEEIEESGEEYLRKKVIDRYHARLEEDELRAKLKAEQDSLFNVSLTNSRRALLVSNISPLRGDDGDSLYLSLKARDKQLFDSGKNVATLTEETPEQTAYKQQSKILKPLVPQGDESLMSGVLYYRVKGQLTQERFEEMQGNEMKKMATLHKHTTRRYSNAFAQKLDERRRSTTSGADNVSSLHAKKGEDANMVTADDVRSLADVKEMHLARLSRAVESKAAQLETLFSSNLPVGSPLKGLQVSNQSMKAEIRQPQTIRSSMQLRQLVLDDELAMAETQKRLAQDRLLFSQLEAGILPETFIKPGSDPLSIMINLSKYGIGDVRGLCLSKCVTELHNLESLGLSDNRLTAVSLPSIINNLNPLSVLNLDISFNMATDHGAKAIANHFNYTNNVLRYLNLSNCEMHCTDMKIICQVLRVYPNNLEELNLAGNKIAAPGAIEICGYIASRTCSLQILDLSWNKIGEVGAIEFGNALTQNQSLVKLNLAANSMGDMGGQRFIDCLREHTVLQEINLSQNGISDGACFVVARVVHKHPSMKKLDLSLNPLGEAGARSIFRNILRGQVCFVMMRNCSYKDDPTIYNHAYPSMQNPYLLDLSIPYCRAVLQEMMVKYTEDSLHCSFSDIIYKDGTKGPDTIFQVQLIPNPRDRTKRIVAVKSNPTEEWDVPKIGTVRFQFHQSVFVPTMENQVPPTAFNILCLIVEHGQSDQDKKQWLALLCQDLFFSTKQAQNMIERFKKKKTIGDGGLAVMDLLCSLWKYLIDTENMFDFLCLNLEMDKRRDLIYALTMKRYKFNWLNPTGHWRLNLADKVERAIMMQLIAINNSESEFSKLLSGRMDTSQQGNWYNFRNEKFTASNNQTTEIIIDREFIKNLPSNGIVEFDYVSTMRPHPDEFANTVESDSNSPIPPTPKSGKADAETSQPSTARGSAQNTARSLGNSKGAPSSTIASESEDKAPTLRIATDDDLYFFMQQLGLSSRSKISPAQAIYTLMDLQLASTKFFFLTRHILQLLDTFEESWDIQAKVVITMFSRIKDIHNMDVVMRTLSTKAQLEVFKRLGCLNLINPLKISADYVLCLKFQDNRTLARQLMELASFESADQIMEDPNTDLPVATLYGSMTRVENDVRPEVMRFTYADFGVRTNNVLWHRRRDLLSRFLVGTQPMSEEIFQTISMFKELEAAGALLQGPIDQQYASYQKSKKSNFQRVVKNTKSMTSVMRAAKESFAASAATAAASGGGSASMRSSAGGMSTFGIGATLSPIQTAMPPGAGSQAPVSSGVGSSIGAFTPPPQGGAVAGGGSGADPLTLMSPGSHTSVTEAANVMQTMISQRKQRGAL